MNIFLVILKKKKKSITDNKSCTLEANNIFLLNHSHVNYFF